MNIGTFSEARQVESAFAGDNSSETGRPCALRTESAMVPTGSAASRPPGVGPAGAVDYLVMELVADETPAPWHEKGALPVAERLWLGGQIADALSHAHRAGASIAT